jgi:tetratricopeptide (TPR) repeat protein
MSPAWRACKGAADVPAGRRLLLILLATAAAACSVARPATQLAPPPDDSDRMVRLADACVEAGDYREALRLLTAVASLSPASPFQDRALFGLGRLLVQPGHGIRDYWQAYAAFDRLTREHADSPYADEARAWRDVLVGYLSQSRELEQRAQELDDSTEALERYLARGQELQQRMRDLERQLERRTQELERRTRDLERQLERRTQELERLKRLDLELEQRRRTTP